MTQVRLMVEPLLTWRSGEPWIRTWGTERFVVKILKYTFSFYFTTYYVKCYGVGLRGLCWNLTLIYTSISFLYKNFKSSIFGFKVLLNLQLTCTYLISKTHSSSELCFAANLWSDVKVCSPAVRMWTSLCLTQETF